MRQTLALSRLYLVGALRKQAHLAALLVAFALLFLPSYVNAFSLGLHGFERVAKDFGLTLMSLFSVAMAVLLGSTTVRADLTSRALYPLLARPLSRGAYLSAHYLALLVLLAASLLLQAAALCAGLAWLTKGFDASVLLATYGIFLQAAVLGAVCLAFSIRCSPPLAGTIGVAAFLIGNLSGAFIRFFLVEDRDSVVSAALARGLKAIVPNLALLDLKDPAVHHLTIPVGYLPAISYYTGIWVVLLLLLAQLTFRRLDL